MRMRIAAVLYPIFEALLFGVGAIAAAVLGPHDAGQFSVVVNCALAALVLAGPLAWEAAPLLMSVRERQRMEEDD